MSDFNFFLNRQGPKGAQGVKGDTGFSPTITPSADNDGLTTYKLVITNENNTYETDNLMGNLNIVDDGGTYLRYDREIGSVRAAEADTATANGAGVIRLSNSTDYENLANDTAMTPSSFVDNYNSLFTNGSGILLSQNADDKIVIAIDDSTIVTEADLTNALANYVTSSNLSSTLADYVTSSSLSTTLSSYATQQWVNSQGFVNTIDNQVISGKKEFRDTTQIDYIIFPDGGHSIASISDSLSLVSNADSYGRPTTDSTSLQLTSNGNAMLNNRDILVNNANNSSCLAVGSGARTYLGNSIAIGPDAVTNWGYSIQLGTGTNTSSRTFSVGFGDLGNYTLLDGGTGLIPDDRLSSNIARTSQIPSASTYSAGKGLDINSNNEINIVQEGESTGDVSSYSWDFTIIGNPIITDGVCTDFTADDYLRAKTIPSGTISSFEIFFDFITPTDISSYAGIIGQKSTSVNMQTPQITIENGHLDVELSASGLDWDCVLDGAIEANKAYTLKVEWSSSNKIVSAILTDKTTGVSTNLPASTDSDRLDDISWTSEVCVGIDAIMGGAAAFRDGYINLNNSYIKVNGELFDDITSSQMVDVSNVAVATNSLFGLVKPDNSTIIVKDGVISLSPTILAQIETLLNALNSNNGGT